MALDNNKKNLLNSAVVSSEELWTSRRVLSATFLLALHNSSDDTQPHSIVIKYLNL